ncbi:peptidoglycan D,D-transpeptidase FtsI family protein [Sphingomonas aerophila]|uniref:Cell division protein FtsI (Penicillin-binding protein 3) n=1 Tax=Sphingomonas aerophila TaxID=1344948 RepID=A0A7W9BEP1_9SPHN|nr:penicillin-binding protein 2 [Sphingomonas aerophila]MBB5715771.1 cell division protein FtsI (penicillin-binding protein 3) [Sphingomonas aerophila]
MTVLVACPVNGRRSAGQRHQLVATSHMRLMMLLALFAAAVLVVIGRLAMLAMFAGPADAAARVATLAARGDLTDRNGAPLARTIDAWTIAVHPRKLVGDPADIAAKLAALMPEKGDQAWFERQLRRDTSFVWLQQRASPALVEQVNAIGEPAIEFGRQTQRLYPQSSLAAHALGFLSTDGHGMSGMERVLDAELLSPARAGKPIQLSLDTRVQAAMESELSRAMTTFSARGAAGLVLDVNTGEVISMVSLPVFNPNRVGMSGSEQLRNNTVQSVYELGSTFKPITVATALESGVVKDISRRFDATKPLHVGRFTIHDEAGDPKRWLNMPETLIYSSNIATARIADELGPQRLQAMFRRLGLDTKPDIELREKGRPLWPTYWARTTTMTTAYGHGIAITPLQLAAAYAALVNGGTWRPSTLLKVGPGHPVPPGRRVISESTSYRMRQMLRLIVLKGTGRKGEAPGYRVAGKTGTGEIPAAGGYDRSRNMATFVATFPIDNPRYVVLSMLDSPKGTKETGGWKTAAWNAAPVVGRVVSRVGAMLGVIPDATRDIDESDLLPLLWTAPGEKQADAN